MKNKFVYIWGALFLIAIISIICYSRRQFSDNEDRIIRPCRFSINAVIEAVNGNLFDVVITSEDSEIKKGTNLTVRVPNNFKKLESILTPGNKITIHYFTPCNYVEGEIWEPDDISINNN